MRTLALILCAVLAQAAPEAGPHAEQRFFRYRAPVTLATASRAGGKAESPARSPARSCAVLPASVFTHADATLADLRLYAGASEVPFVITESKSTLRPPDPARVIDLGMAGRRISFDLAMPNRAYTEVRLRLAGENFIAAADVSGELTPGAATTIHLGQFTLFDLTGQHLARNTTLPLPESGFPFLHVTLSVSAAPGFQFTPAPGMVTGAEVPPDLEAQTLYTPVVSTSAFAQRGRETFAALDLAAHVPVERVRFALRPGTESNFSRAVRVTATPVGNERDGAPAQPETVTGIISRVHLPVNAASPQPVDSRSLTLDATLGANLKRPASVEVAVENGDDQPLPLASVTLEMRQRKLCFDTPASGTPVMLLYGDPALPAPEYDYARLFDPGAPASTATLGPEQLNPAYHSRPEPARAFTERHPRLLWLALLAVVGSLGFVAFRQGSSPATRP